MNIDGEKKYSRVYFLFYYFRKNQDLQSLRKVEQLFVVKDANKGYKDLLKKKEEKRG
jgi:hypothetical protein